MATQFPDDEIEVKSKDFYESLKEYNFNDCKYSLLIVGPSGAGKSTFCNFLIREKRFLEAVGMLSGTEEAAYCSFPHYDEKVLIVDCPGFCDPKRPHEEILTEICKAAILCREGVDAIGIVINPMERFSESERVSYDQIEMFGENFWKHSFLIFNNEHKIKKKLGFNEPRDYIVKIKNDSKCPPQFTKLIEKVENRFVCVESSKRFGDDEYRNKIRDNVHAMILQIRENNDELYVNGFMKQGRITFDELISIREEMNILIQSIKDEMTRQGDRLAIVEAERRSETSYFTARIDQLSGNYERRIIQYESEIKELQSSVSKKICSVM